MFKNYIKLAFRVLKNKKFFSFITLFGISFTLGILMVIISFLETELGSNAPLSNKDRLVYINMMCLQTVYYDTIPTIDSTIVDGVASYDTTYEYNRSGRSLNISNVSLQLLQSFYDDVPSVETASFFVEDSSFDVFLNGQKLTINASWANAETWDVFDFQFTEGRPFDTQDVKQGRNVVVITDELADNYFGRKNNVLSETIEMDGRTFTVIGVVKKPALSDGGGLLSRDAFLPHTIIPEAYTEDYYYGGFRAAFMGKPGYSREQIKQDLLAIEKTIPLDHPDNRNNYREAKLTPSTFDENYAQNFYMSLDPEESYTYMRRILIAVLLFFVLLPTLNLINLNISRILDRSSEIGVRKAFGANYQHIISQFIFENIIQTILGGLIGLLLAVLVIYLINDSQVLGDTRLLLNGRFFIVSLFTCLFFGVLSGVLPAWRMSRLPIVKALKENKL